MESVVDDSRARLMTFTRMMTNYAVKCQHTLRGGLYTANDPRFSLIYAIVGDVFLINMVAVLDLGEKPLLILAARKPKPC